MRNVSRNVSSVAQEAADLDALTDAWTSGVLGNVLLRVPLIK